MHTSHKVYKSYLIANQKLISGLEHVTCTHKRLNGHLLLRTIFGNPRARSRNFLRVDWFIRFDSFSKFGTYHIECSHTFGKSHLWELHVSTHFVGEIPFKTVLKMTAFKCFFSEAFTWNCYLPLFEDALDCQFMYGERSQALY